MKSFFFLFLFFLNMAALGQNISNSEEFKSPYSLETTRETILLGGGGAMGITGLIMMNNITPLTPEEIAQLDPNDINAFDRHDIGTYRESMAGDLLLYASFLLPLNFLANENTKRDWKILAVIGAEVLLVQAGLNAIFKGVTLRTRPYVYDPDTPMDIKTSKNARVSFYSGHTATTTALSFYVAKVFSDYLENSTTKTLIWAGAAMYPALVGYLRRDSGHHFRTDVLTGYAVGALIGYFVPELHKVSKDNQVSADYSFYPGFTGISIKYNF